MAAQTDSAQFTPLDSLRLRRDRAERILNGLRAGVLCLLIAAGLAVVECLAVDVWLFASHRIEFVMNPMAAISQAQVSPLDEAAKILLLAIAGVIATYAASWVEHLVIEASRESAERQRVATRLVQAELDTLKLQLSPHFLFNALNSAVALIGS